MAVQHNVITDPNIHEPKGVSTASIGQIYVADGAGSGDWRVIPHAQCYASDIGSGTTITAPTAYSLIAPATIGDANPRDFTHNSLNRLTYTGSVAVDCSISASISFKHSTGSGQDCFFQIFKNGVAIAGTEMVASADSANYQHISLHVHASVALNDYLEVYCKTATGNIIVHAITLEARGMI